MEKLIKVADSFIDKIRKDYPDDVACVVLMGSLVFNETHIRSDLDLFFVPKTDRGYNLGKTFILDGIGFDFWPISWERLERIASYGERITSIILDGKLIYYNTEEDFKKYEDLRLKASDTTNREMFIKQADELFTNIYKTNFELSLSETLREVRKNSILLLNTLSNIIALINSTVIRRGRGRLKDEILNMKYYPKSYKEVFELTFTSDDISLLKNKYLKLIKEVKSQLLVEKSKLKQEKKDLRELEGFYEELINLYNKIYYNCEAGNPYTPLFAAVEIQVEWEDAFDNTGLTLDDLPDIISIYDINHLDDFSEIAKEHQTKLERLISNNGIEITRFNDFTEYNKWISKEL